LIRKNSCIHVFTEYNPSIIQKIKSFPQRYWNGNHWIIPSIYEERLNRCFSISVLPKYTSFYSPRSTEEIKHLFKHLFDYQKAAVIKYLSNSSPLSNNSIIINFDIGAGKTITSIQCAICSRYNPPYLVITKASLIGEFREQLKIHTPTYEKDFHIISYEYYRNHTDKYRNYELVILDEVTKFKSYKSKIYKQLLLLNCKSKIFLTGLLLENNLQELYAILSIFNKNIFYNFYDFKQRYLITRKNAFGGFEVVGYKNISNLVSILDEIRVTASPKLKHLTVRNRIYELNKYAKLYNKLLDEYTRSKSFGASAFGASVQLKELAISPYLLNPKFKYGGKIDELIGVIKECGKKKIIIFCCYKKIQELLKKILSNYDVQYISSSNKHTLHTNSQIIVSTDCLAYGKNLQSYDVIINLDIPWNPAIIKQRIGRINRIGQNNNPIVINLIMKGTIDEKIMKIVKKKVESIKFINVIDI